MHDAPSAANMSSKKVQSTQIGPRHVGGDVCSSYRHRQWTETYPPLNEMRSNKESLEKELAEAKKRISKLEGEQLHACKVIQSMIDLKKKTARETEVLKKIVAERNIEIQNLIVRNNKVKTCTGNCEGRDVVPSITQSLRAKITELSLMTTVNGPNDSKAHTHFMKSDAAQMKSIFLNFGKKRQ